MEQELTISDVCDMSGTPHAHLWLNRFGEHKPAKPGNGKRGSARYTLCMALSIRVARSLDKRFGIEPKDLIGLTSHIWNMGTAELLAEFDKNKTCVIVVGRKVCDTFFPPTAVNDFDAALKARGANGIDVFAISVEHEFKRMCETLAPEQLLPEPEVN